MRVKHSFISQHFATARYFATRSQELEQGINGADQDENDENIESMISIHRSYVTGAIVTAVAGLESSINELYLDACDNNTTGLLCGLSDASIALMAEWWEEIERRPILLKFQHALLLTCGEGFDKGSQPYQDVDGLVKLRNALVHYKPEWDSDAEVHADLQNRLASRFPMNPLVGETALWFPHQCLGSGCAMWAVDTSVRFLQDFCDRMGIGMPGPAGR